MQVSNGRLEVTEVDQAGTAPEGVVLLSKVTPGVVRVTGKGSDVDWCRVGEVVLIREGAHTEVTGTSPLTAVIRAHEVWAVIRGDSVVAAPGHAVIDVTEGLEEVDSGVVWLPDVEKPWPNVGTTELDGEECQVLYNVTDPQRRIVYRGRTLVCIREESLLAVVEL